MQLNKLAVQDAQVMFGDNMGAHSWLAARNGRSGLLRWQIHDNVLCFGRAKSYRSNEIIGL